MILCARNYGIGNLKSNQSSLDAAVEAAAKIMNAAVKPVLVAGSKLHVAKASPAFEKLADACGYAVAMMPDAKGRISEALPHFIGTYWGCVSSSCTSEIVESADCYLFAGPVFNDYRYTHVRLPTLLEALCPLRVPYALCPPFVGIVLYVPTSVVQTHPIAFRCKCWEYKYIKKANVRCDFSWGGCFSSVGYSLLLHKSKSITVQPDRVTIGEGMSFGCILMRDFFKALAERVERNTTSFENYERMYVPLGTLRNEKEGEPIKTLTLFKHIQVSTIITCTKTNCWKK